MNRGLPLFNYRAVTTVAAIPAATYTLMRSSRDGGWLYLRQRYAHGLPATLREYIGIHCCSVGEVNAAAPLVQELRTLGHSIFLSVTTPTGHRIAQRLLPDIPCVYFPLDHVATVQTWLRRLQPKALLIMETELWPNFFDAAQRLEIPLALINARLTKRSNRAPFFLRRAFRHALTQVHCILTRSEEDREKFLARGAEPERVECLGNIKYATRTQPVNATRPIPQPYVLAASTHENEEEQLARLWQALDAKGHLLVLLPRHPERAEDILARLQALGLNTSQHTKAQAPRSDDALYVVDTLGEARWWMQHAAFVFLGGSLIPHGGHNLLEPAALGKACVIGPHIENFAQEAQDLLAAGGLRQVEEAQALGAVFHEWLQQPGNTVRVGAAAAAHVATHQQVVQNYVAALRHYGVLPE